jgi:hypothetical protein
LFALINFTFACSPFLVTLTVFAVYTSLDPSNILSADKMFVCISLFNIMRIPLTMFPWALIEFIKVLSPFGLSSIANEA